MLLLLFLTLGAVIFFAALYWRTMGGYMSALKEVRPIIDGKFKMGALLHSIKLEGSYKRRQVVCGLEQLKEGGESLFVKIKVRTPLPANIPLARIRAANIITLDEGWIMPNFFISRKSFSSTNFLDILDRLSDVCEGLEQGKTNIEEKKIQYKVEYKRDYKG